MISDWIETEGGDRVGTLFCDKHTHSEIYYEDAYSAHMAFNLKPGHCVKLKVGGARIEKALAAMEFEI